MSRRDQLRDKDVFDSNPTPSPDEIDQAVFGELQDVDKQRLIAEARPIDAIYPDLRQPRRVIPSRVRQVARLEPEGMTELFLKWKGLAQKEHGSSFEFQKAIESEKIIRWMQSAFDDVTEETHPITASLLKVVRLARSIYRDGLINPITVVRDGKRYRIHTGERRWWAYQLLHTLYGMNWATIPSRVVPEDVWSQAAENVDRQDLNAVGMARQLALLLMDLIGGDWLPVEGFLDEQGCDRGFYAQVVEERIPYGKSEDLAAAMGIGPTGVRNYRRLLTLPDEIWLQADDESWPLNRCLDWLAQQNRDDRPDRIISKATTAVEPDEDDEIDWDARMEEKAEWFLPMPETAEKVLDDLTDFEREVWYDFLVYVEKVKRQHGDSFKGWFVSGDVFPGNDNEVSARRQALVRLAEKGYLEQQGRFMHFRLPSSEATVTTTVLDDDHVEVAHIDRGEDADEVYVADNQAAARVRLAKVAVPMREIFTAVEQLSETRNVEVLAELDVSERVDLVRALAGASDLVLDFVHQVLGTMTASEIEEFEGLIILMQNIDEKLATIEELIQAAYRTEAQA